VAGEAHGGTLRYLLTVPVGRLRLLLVKYAGIAVYSFVSTLVVALVGVLIGVILFGGGSMTLLSGNQIGFAEGLLRVVGAALYLGAGMASLGAVGLFISTLTEQPIAATLATVVFSAGSLIIDQIPQMGFLHPYLLVHHWTDFSDLFRFPILWTGVTHGLYVDLAYVVVAFLAAWARFSVKDITS
jgi:ABC-2 type transport system permease protein